MKSSERPKIGTKVRVTMALVKRHRWTGRHRHTEWRQKPLTDTAGVYIGYRWVREGVSEYDYDEGGSVFTAARSMLVALVVTDPRRNPIRVPFDHLKVDE